MPAHPFHAARGRLVELTIDSQALRGNLLGDPHVRRVYVYLPEAYDEDPRVEYPLFVNLAAYTGSGLAGPGWRAFGESLPQRLDRLVAAGAMGPVVCAMPDCFTSLGGNQYVDSVAMGLWEQFVVRELVPTMECRFRVRRSREGRAVFGKSSGGYGALVYGMLHADAFGAVACHSGDMAFDLLYLRDFPPALDVLGNHEGIAGFLSHIEGAAKVDGRDFTALMVLAMCATYDPDPGAHKGIRLPVDPATCTLHEDRFARWLAHDPVRMVLRTDCQTALRSLRGLYVDVGTRDQYYLHYGARQLVRALREAGIEHFYEEFPDSHSGIDYRLDVSLPFLYRALAGPAEVR